MSNKFMRFLLVLTLALAPLAIQISPANAAGSISLPASNTSGFNTTSFVSVSSSGTTPTLTGFSAGVYKVAISATSGFIKVPTTTGLTLVSGSASGTASSYVFTTNSIDNLNNAIGSLQFKGSVAGNADITIEVTDSSGNAFVTGTGANNHYYETYSDGNGTWTDAKNKAALKSVPSTTGGTCTGYLVTVTSSEEQAFLGSRLTSASWLGATDTQTERTWRWVTGPEAGTIFFYQGVGPASGAYSNWASNEPNDYNNGVPGEDYAQFIAGGKWNDLPDDGGISNYIVEYGSPTCTPNVATVNTMTAVVAGTPSAPTGLTVTPGDASVTLNFNAVTGSSLNGGTLVRYEYSKDGGAWVSTGTSTSASVSGLINGTSYSFRVRTITTSNGELTSSASSSVSATPLTVPSAPTLNNLVADNNALALRFTASTTAGAAVTGYQYSTDAGATWKSLSGTTSPQYASTTSSNTALVAGDSYTVLMRATSSAGNSSSSGTLTATYRAESSFSISNFKLGGLADNAMATINNANNEVTLTPSTGGRAGSLWATNRIDLTKDFVINASVYLGSNDAGADGMAFVIQPSDVKQLSSGGGLGYSSINPSFAVEFDTYQNGSEPAQDHIAYMKNGATTVHNAFGVSPYEVSLEDGTWRDVRFIWNSDSKAFTTEFEVTNGQALTQILTRTVDLTAVDLLNSTQAYWGFTAATGGAYNQQQVKVISYTAAGRINTAPTITQMPSIEVEKRSATSSYTVTLSDDSTTASQWIVTATSSDTSIATVSVPSANITQNSARLSVAATGNVAGTTNITVTATDADGAQATMIFPFVVSINYSPTFTSATPQNGTADSRYSYSFEADALPAATFAIASGALPAGLVLGTDGTLSGTPTEAGSFTFTVRASNNLGSTNVTKTISIALTDPSAPRSVVAAVTGAKIRVSWLAPSTLGGSAISNYLVTARAGNSSATCSTTTTSCDLENLTAGLNYLITVSATNTSISGTDAKSSVATTPVRASIPASTTSTTSGSVPAQVTPRPVTSLLGNVNASNQTALINSGVIAPPPSVPVINVAADLSAGSISTPTTVVVSQTIESGAQIDLAIKPPTDTPVGTAVFGTLILADGTTFDLGQIGITSDHLTNGFSLSPFTILPVGKHFIELRFGETTVAPAVYAASSFSFAPLAEAAPAYKTLSTGSQINVKFEINIVAGPNGVPTIQKPAPTASPTPTRSATPTPTPSESETVLAEEAPTPEPTVEAAAEPEVVVDARGLEVTNPLTDAPLAVAETTLTAVALVAAVSAAGAAAAAAGAAAGAASAGAASGGGAARAGSGASGGGSGSGGSGSGSSGGAGGDSNSEGEDDASIEGVDFEHEGFEVDANAWGDSLKVWSIPVLAALDEPSHKATEKLAPITPLVSKLISDAAYLKAMLGSISLLFPILGVFLGLHGISESGGQLLPPTAPIITAIAVIGVLDAFAGFIAMAIYTTGMILTAGVHNAADLRMLLGLVIIGFGPSLLASAFRGLRRQAEDGHHYWWERLTDLAVAPFLGGWATKGMVEALTPLAGVELPIHDHANAIAISVAIALMVRILLEEFSARFFPSRLNFIHPTDVPSPTNMQKIIALTLRAAVFFFVAGAFIGNSWHLYVGTFLFIAPSYLALYQDRFPNYPRLYQILPAGLPGLAFTLLVASGSLSALTAVLGETPELAQIAFVVLPIPSVILSILGMFGREPAEGDVRWYQRAHLTWLYRIGGIVMLVYTMRLTGII